MIMYRGIVDRDRDVWIVRDIAELRSLAGVREAQHFAVPGKPHRGHRRGAIGPGRPEVAAQ